VPALVTLIILLLLLLHHHHLPQPRRMVKPWGTGADGDDLALTMAKCLGENLDQSIRLGANYCQLPQAPHIGRVAVWPVQPQLHFLNPRTDHTLLSPTWTDAITPFSNYGQALANMAANLQDMVASMTHGLTPGSTYRPRSCTAGSATAPPPYSRASRSQSAARRKHIG
jgi:hypothetical protein